MTLCLMSLKTGAYKPRPGLKNRLGGYDEDGISVHIPQARIQHAVEQARLKRRAATRKYFSNPRRLEGWFKAEKRKIDEELWVQLGKPNTPTKQRQIIEAPASAESIKVRTPTKPSPESVIHAFRELGLAY